jgi:D-alanyl-D-alanine carboxypeptidase/D-alanyl-D-alanine-endopeptidase (penicillin-binding protein 4)
MSQMFKIRLRIYIIIASFLFHLSAHSQNKVQESISNLAARPTNKNAKISFKAIDLATGKDVASYKSSLAIPSASTTKLFSTGTAFELLGSNFTTSTRIYCKGKIGKDSVLYGDIYIRGGGDVSLGSRFFCEKGKELAFLNRWTDSLKAKGIKKIQGSVICDGSEFGYAGTPKSWNWDDIGNYYGAAAQGVNFYDNTIKIYFKTKSVGQKSQVLEIFPKISNFSFKNDVIAGKVSDDNVIVFGANYSLNRYAQGSLPINQERFEVKGSMPDPEFQLAEEWVKVLQLRGLIVRDGAKGLRLDEKQEKINYGAETKFLFQEKSKSVKEIAYWANFKSVNLFAEGLLNYIGLLQKNDGSTNTSIHALEKFWLGKINIEGLILKDGCGLSKENAISATHFCDLLKYLYSSKNYSDFKSTLPIAGVSGTIKNLCKGQAGEGRIYAKSGTISKVKSYAGYVVSKTGKNIAFAITVNNYGGSNSQVITEIEKVLNELANY